METTEAVEAQVQQPDMNEAPAPTTEVPTAKRKGNSAQRTLTTLCNLYFSEGKPDGLQPLDVALATYLILRQSDDHVIFDSQDTLAGRLGCERKAIARSIDRLKAAGWLFIEERFDWNSKTHRKARARATSSALAVNFDHLPQIGDRAKRTSTPSEGAKQLAARHTRFLELNATRGTRNFAKLKRFKQQQQYAAQRLIDETGTAEMALTVVNFALNDPRFTSSVKRSLYEVRKRLPAILRAFNDHQQQQQQQQPEAAAPAAPDSSQPPQ